MASGTETIRPTAYRLGSSIVGTSAACSAGAAPGDPGPTTGTCLAPDSVCPSAPLQGASIDYYSWETPSKAESWWTAVRLKVKFSQTAWGGACSAVCQVAKTSHYYKHGVTFVGPLSNDDSCSTSASQILSDTVALSAANIANLTVAVVQWAAAKNPCTLTCSPNGNALSIEDVWIEIDWTEPTGACCTGTSCAVSTEADCVAASGTYQGNGTTCAPNPCTNEAKGACCVSGVCSGGLTKAACTGGGGTYLGDGSTCTMDTTPCTSPTGACCVGSECWVTTEDICNGIGGSYQGDSTSCSPSPCPQTPPAGGLIVS